MCVRSVRSLLKNNRVVVGGRVYTPQNGTAGTLSWQVLDYQNFISCFGAIFEYFLFRATSKSKAYPTKEMASLNLETTE